MGKNTVKKASDRSNACLRAEITKPLDLTWEEFKGVLRIQRKATCVALNSTVTEFILAERSGNIEGPRETKADHLAKEAFNRIGAKMWGRNKSAVGRVAYQAIQRYHEEVNDGMARALPSFKLNTPVFIRGDAWDVSMHEDTYVLNVGLIPEENGKGKTRTRIAVKLKDWWQYCRLDKIARDQSYKRGDLKIVQSAKDKHKWFAIMSYSFPKPEKRTGGTIAAHRGVKTFLFVAAEDGTTKPLVDGGDIVAFKSQMLARKRSIGHHKPELGDGAHGHGRKRFEAAITRLRDKEDRFTTTKCQQAAALLIKFALERGAAVILIEDYGTIPDDDANWMVQRWPWAKLKECIKWACEKAGIELKEVPSAYNGKTCPKCGETKEVMVNDGHFHCLACGLHSRTDGIAAWNMLRTFGAETGIEVAENLHKAKMAKVKKHV